jgi:hypothetical protein
MFTTKSDERNQALGAHVGRLFALSRIYRGMIDLGLFVTLFNLSPGSVETCAPSGIPPGLFSARAAPSTIIGSDALFRRCHLCSGFSPPRLHS